MSSADLQHDWNGPESIDTLKHLISRLPGVKTVQTFGRAEAFVFRVRCSDMRAVNALADSVGWANGRVFVHGEVVAQRQTNGDVNSVLCEFCVDKDDDQSNTLVYSIGFYVAVWLFERGLMKDEESNKLEAIWPINFVMHRG